MGEDKKGFPVALARATSRKFPSTLPVWLAMVNYIAYLLYLYMKLRCVEILRKLLFLAGFRVIYLIIQLNKLHSC